MQQSAFVERRSPVWNRLETLVDRIGRRGVRTLETAEIAEFGRLYRAATSDLAFAQGHDFDAGLRGYLNRLIARAHSTIYGGTQEAGWSRFLRFYTETFPQEFRRSFSFFAICTALTIVSAIVAYVVIRTHPADAYSLLPSGMIPPEIKRSLHDSNFAVNFESSPGMAAQIITNNVRVAFMAFAGCVTLGALTIYDIIFNGLMVGGLGALFTNAGFGYDFWATIAPHGFIELTAIQIAGASGLLIAAGILYPGRLRRRDAIRVNARRAGILIIGVASMLLIAGTIEGFFSPRRLPANLRAEFGCITAIALIGYFGFIGRRKSEDPL